MKIHIPAALRPFTEKNSTVEVPGTTVADGLAELTGRYPDLRRHVFNDEGRVRAFVNIYLNDEDIRFLKAKDATPVQEGDSISIIPSIAGGCS